MRMRSKQHFGLASGLLLAASMTGCDYWPPALQAQIEQLRSERETITTENTQLQSQVKELLKEKQDLLTQVNELSQANREKTSLIASLQRQVDALRAKTAKAMTPKPVAKPSARKSAKHPVRKTPAAKRQ